MGNRAERTIGNRDWLYGKVITIRLMGRSKVRASTEIPDGNRGICYSKRVRESHPQ